MPFYEKQGLLTDVFLSSSEFVDRYTGNELWNWGYNNAGHLGDNTVTSRSSPVQTIAKGTNWKQVAKGNDNISAIKTDGTLWAWHSFTPDNASVNRSSPVQIVGGGTNWKQTSPYGAIKTDGTLWLWGNNDNGQIGDNTRVSKSSPLQTICSGTNWKQISTNMAGGSNIHSSAAIKTDGTLWCWGNNVSGQLGDNTTIGRSSPVQTVSAGTNWKQVSAGGRLISAIKTDGTLWCWGDNYSGYLGDNTTISRSSPVQTVAGGTNWKQVSSYNINTAAIKTDGTLWLWGYNLSGGGGKLGDNTTIDKSSPVQTICSGTNWKQVSVYDFITSAIKTDGTLWVWGYNLYGDVGDGTVIDRSSPVQTITGGSNWRQVSGSAALRLME